MSLINKVEKVKKMIKKRLKLITTMTCMTEGLIFLKSKSKKPTRKEDDKKQKTLKPIKPKMEMTNSVMIFKPQEINLWQLSPL